MEKDQAAFSWTGDDDDDDDDDDGMKGPDLSVNPD